MRPKKVILLVDDLQAVLSVRTFLMETWGYAVHATNCPNSALEFFERNHVDLVVTDLGMTPVNGSELAGMMKAVKPEVPIQLTSTSVVNWDGLGSVDAFFPKGTGGPQELREKMRMMCARKRGPRKGTPGRKPVQSVTDSAHNGQIHAEVSA